MMSHKGFVLNTDKENKDKNKNRNDIDNSAKLVKTEGNKIYFYASVNEKSVLELNNAIDILSATLPFQAAKFGITEPHIDLHINSFGGYLTDGMAALDCLLTCPIPINTYIDGAAASAATLFSVAGKNRFIGKHAVMLIHQLTSVMWGKYNELQDEIKNLDQWMKVIKGVYKEYTDVPMDKIDEILKHDLWFDAKKCRKLGLVDYIL